MDTDDLKRLAREMDGRITIHCGKCRNWQRLSLEARSLRFGSSPDLSAVDPNQPGRPRLQFYCTYCHRIIGFVTADAHDDPEGTRWEHLEL